MTSLIRNLEWKPSTVSWLSFVLMGLIVAGIALSGLKGSKSLQERERHRVELVLGEVDRLDALLSETLDYVRPVKLSAEPVVMDRLLSRVLKQQEPLMAEKSIRTRREICTECPATRLDEAKMHQVLLNLLKNAVEAGPEGSEIGVRLQRDEGGLALEIANGGEPLNPETLERAFALCANVGETSCPM